MNLSRINLNLLVVLDVLLKERHVTKASQILHVTQSTISASLNQLRSLFKDELLIREKNQMVLTPKAQMLAPKIHDFLQQLKMNIFNEIEFDPKTTQRTFILAMDDYLECLLLPELNQVLAENAPGFEIIIRHADSLNERLLSSESSIDLGIGSLIDESHHLSHEDLFTDQLVCAGNSKNSLLQNKLSLKNYLNAEHLTLSNNELKITDIALAEKSLQRKIHLSVTHISTALYLLASSNLLASIPSLLVKKAKVLLDLTYQPLPFAVQKIYVKQIWHKQVDNDPAHLWLRQLIKKILLNRLNTLE